MKTSVISGDVCVCVYLYMYMFMFTSMTRYEVTAQMLLQNEMWVINRSCVRSGSCNVSV